MKGFKVLTEKKNNHHRKNRTLTYDKLIIATGSSAFILPVEGSTLPGVTGFRTIEDTQFMIDTANEKKKAVVIGGGLLGLEAARGLIDLGMDVYVVHLMPLNGATTRCQSSFSITRRFRSARHAISNGKENCKNSWYRPC